MCEPIALIRKLSPTVSHRWQPGINRSVLRVFVEFWRSIDYKGARKNILSLKKAVVWMVLRCKRPLSWARYPQRPDSKAFLHSRVCPSPKGCGGYSHVETVSHGNCRQPNRRSGAERLKQSVMPTWTAGTTGKRLQTPQRTAPG